MAVAPSRLGAAEPASVSMEEFNLAVRNVKKCQELFHNNVDSCAKACYLMMLGGYRGTFKFFFPVYMLQLVFKWKKIDRLFLKKLLVEFFRSMTFGATMTTLYIASSCILFRICGGARYYTSVFIPATIGGLGIFVNAPDRRPVLCNALQSTALEYFVSKRRLSRRLETVVFMLVNAVLMYLLRQTPNTSEIFWVFFPPRKSFPGSCCPHPGPCWIDVLKGGGKYACLAVIWQLGRFLITRGFGVLAQPKRLLQKLRSRSTVDFALSLGSYAFLYKAVHCLLCRRYGCDLPVFAAIAGLAAGSAYALDPRLDEFCSAIIAVITLSSRRSDGKPRCPRIPVSELLTALCFGTIFNARCMDAAYCPSLGFQMMDAASGGMAEDIYKNFVGKFNEANSKFSSGDLS